MYTKVKDKEAQKKAMAATKGLCSKRPQGLMQFLEGRYPRVPAEYLVSYRQNFAPRPPPPLDILCPKADFKQAGWDSVEPEMASWLKQVQDRQMPYVAGYQQAMDAQLVSLFSQLVDSEYESEFAYRSHGFACPDVYLCRRPKSPMVVCFMDMDNLLQDEEEDSEAPHDHSSFNGLQNISMAGQDVAGNGLKQAGRFPCTGGTSQEFEGKLYSAQSSTKSFQLVVNRLYHYMQMTGTYFGAVTCLKKTWICKRVWDGGSEVMQLSRPLDRPVMALAFIIAQARLLNLSAPSASLLKLAQQFDSGPILEQLKLACNAVQARHTKKILADVKMHFDLEAVLQDAQVLSEDFDRKTCMVAVRCKYKDRTVVIKARDLSSPWGLGFRASLARVAREVDAYLSMRWIQGVYVPELVEWGFSRGAMFAYIMTSDCGKARVERILAGEPLFSECPEKAKALRGVMDSLREVHNRGILHRDISDSKVVLSRSADGGWRATLVGFAQMRYFETTRSNKIYEEGMQLQKLVKWLMNTH